MVMVPASQQQQRFNKQRLIVDGKHKGEKNRSKHKPEGELNPE